MEVCQDYEDLFRILNAHGIRYLVAGAQAVIYYTEPRYTKDLDVWVIPEMNDPRNVMRALANFGAPLKGLSKDDFDNGQLIIQIGVAPVRVDILLDIEGVDFKKAWKNRKRARYGNVPINVMGIADLIKAKKAAGRPQDIVDLEKLIKVKKKQ
ncbi:MAG: nucleotidyltransferase [Deltaproteobacteria bacterium]|nr:nucleotidyltransferase [Deltaproteobacteria bacterium]